ncbi:DNA polymerase III subunit delta [Sandaracinobacter sp. RS1-74]|uniref:DNA polymerase III subunit delta n=1 Tax=Sandaracinobacteroides sayramensis TaxID=2913411 RepID=UPI001EDBAEF8|nr:DNA polymerase III subunit delta [Sandaracinobacteroides sayramensis]MCG2842831.1 DNA polymerase III subunit delta [Sandaracinobacteroides sayramensis]
MAVLKRGELPRHLSRWNPDVRLLLLAGPDESGTREAAGAALNALGDREDPMSVTELSGDELRSDPGRLADEAASVSMFGGRRVIRVTGAGEAAQEAVRLLLAAPVAGNPVVMLAGELTKASGLRKLAEESPLALALISYPLEGRDLANWLAREAQERGLRLDGAVAERLLATSDGDTGILASELDKYALYLDSSPGEPKRLERAHVAALGADSAEEDMAALVSAVVAADRRAVERQLRLLADGSAIPALRAMARRLVQMAEARAAMESGADPRSAVKGLRPPVYPFREQDLLAAALPQWPMARIRRALSAMLEGERLIKTAGGPGDTAGWQAILGLGLGLGLGGAHA